MMCQSASGRALCSHVAGLSRQILLFAPVMLLLRSLFGLILAYPVTDILSAFLDVELCMQNVRHVCKETR